MPDAVLERMDCLWSVTGLDLIVQRCEKGVLDAFLTLSYPDRFLNNLGGRMRVWYVLLAENASWRNALGCLMGCHASPDTRTRAYSMYGRE